MADARRPVRARDRGSLRTSSRGGRRRPPLASSQRRPWRCASPPAGSATPAPPARPLLGRPIHPNSLRGEARSRGGRRASSRAEPRHGRSSAFGCDGDEASRAPPWRRAFGCACRAEERSRRPEAHAPASARAGAARSVGRAGGRTWVAHGLAAAAAPLLSLLLRRAGSAGAGLRAALGLLGPWRGGAGPRVGGRAALLCSSALLPPSRLLNGCGGGASRGPPSRLSSSSTRRDLLPSACAAAKVEQRERRARAACREGREL